MIRAFVDRRDCGKHIIVRAGPKASEWGRPYKKSCLGEIDGDSVTLMAFCEPWLIQLLRRWFPRIVGSLAPYVRASARALIADGFKKVHLDRLGDFPRHLVFTKGEKEGKLTMSTMPKAADANLHPGALKAAHGGHPSPHGVDVSTVEAGVAAAMKLFKDGTYACLSLNDTVEMADGRSFFIVERKRLR